LLNYPIGRFWNKELKNQSSKNSIRSELRRKTEEYISLGGEIKQHQAGETGEPADKPRDVPRLLVESLQKLGPISMMLFLP
jgi:hypothetical protein